MKQFPLKIVTPDGLVFDGMADALLVRTTTGEVEFMAGHVDYFASLSIGRAKLTVDGEEMNAFAHGGFVSVLSGEVKLVCTIFEFAKDIDLARAKHAKEKAEETLKSANDDKMVKLAKAKLLRAIHRIDIAGLK